MPDLNLEEYHEPDFSDDDENHSKLLSSVAQLDSTQRVKPAQRKEATSKVSEYNLTEKIPSKKNLISINELASVLGKSSKHGVITKKLKCVTSTSKTLPKPMEKSVEEQIKRSIGFENVKNQLQRWDAVVMRNAIKDQMKFPLNDNSTTVQKSDDFLNQFQSSTPLEEEIKKVLKQENKEKEENKEFSLTLEEMLEKRREMAYLRAKLSYRKAKAQRQNKIKSKKYHRILKREKLRQQLKEFELLQKTDPEAALKKLSELDKTRAQERASLRHRNTGQWAKNLTVRAKYDTESRKILAEQLKISRELTQKVQDPEDSDKEEPEKPALWTAVEENAKLDQINKFGDNPWNINISKEVQDFVSGYRKYWNEQNKVATEDLTIKETEECQNKNVGKSEMIREDFIKNDTEIQNLPQPDLKKSLNNKKKPQKFATPKKTKSVSIYPGSGVWIVTQVCDVSDVKDKKKRKGEDIDTLFEELDEQLNENAVLKVKKIKDRLRNQKNIKERQTKKNKEKEPDLSIKNKNLVERPDVDLGLLEGDDVDLKIQSTGNCVDKSSGSKVITDIDPQNFIQVKPKKLRTCVPEIITNEEDCVDNEKRQVMTIEEAFVDDDVIAEFKEMKEETEKNEKIDIETSLPGWGEWGGVGIAPKPKKKAHLVVNVPSRKDKGKKDTIINENANPNIKNHMVKEVPHPFRSVEAFEANIRAPVGREWVPETAHWKLIQKQVETKLGAVIEPMDEDEIVRQKKNHKSPYQGKMKNQEKKIT